MPGRFITFEGPEGSGKSTQLRLLAETLANRGEPVLCTREPGGDPVAEAIRQVLLHADAQIAPRTELLLFVAARAQVVETVLRPNMSAGRVVLCDRYSDSTVAYQAHGRGLPRDEVRAIINYATDDLWPDLTFLLDIPPAVGLARQTEGNRMETEPLAFHERVRRGFLHEAQADPDRFRVINADRDREAIRKDILLAYDGWAIEAEGRAPGREAEEVRP